MGSLLERGRGFKGLETGELAERLNAAVSKTVVVVRRPEVQILHSPLVFYDKKNADNSFKFWRGAGAVERACLENT